MPLTEPSVRSWRRQKSARVKPVVGGEPIPTPTATASSDQRHLQCGPRARDAVWAGFAMFGCRPYLDRARALDSAVTLTGWAKYAVSHWRSWTADLWLKAADVVPLPIPKSTLAGLAMSLFVLLIAVTTDGLPLAFGAARITSGKRSHRNSTTQHRSAGICCEIHSTF